MELPRKEKIILNTVTKGKRAIKNFGNNENTCLNSPVNLKIKHVFLRREIMFSIGKIQGIIDCYNLLDGKEKEIIREKIDEIKAYINKLLVIDKEMQAKLKEIDPDYKPVDFGLYELESPDGEIITFEEKTENLQDYDDYDIYYLEWNYPYWIDDETRRIYHGLSVEEHKKLKSHCY